MNIAIFTAEDYALLFNSWCEFVEKAKEKYNIKAIFVFPNAMKDKKGLGIYLEYLKILGIMDFLRLAVRTLARKARYENKKYSDFDDLGKKNNIPVFHEKNPNQKSVADWVRNNSVDVGLISFDYIMKERTLDAFKLCVVNKHSSLLPAFKGLWSVFWTMYHGADIGVTLHKVDKKIDMGEILLQKKYDLGHLKDVVSVYDSIYREVADLFIGALNNLETGERQIIEHGREASYFSLPTGEEYKSFKEKGFRFS